MSKDVNKDIQDAIRRTLKYIDIPEKWDHGSISHCIDEYDCPCYEIMEKQNKIIDCLKQIIERIS